MFEAKPSLNLIKGGKGSSLNEAPSNDNAQGEESRQGKAEKSSLRLVEKNGGGSSRSPDVRAMLDRAPSNDNAQGKAEKPAARTAKEQEFYVNSRVFQRQGLGEAMGVNKAEQTAFQALIDESTAYLAGEGVKLKSMLEKQIMLESKQKALENQQKKNQESWLHGILARGSGTDVSNQAEVLSLQKTIQENKDTMDMIGKAQEELKQLIKQKQSIDAKQAGWEKQAQDLDAEIAQETIVELPAEDLEIDMDAELDAMSEQDLMKQQESLKKEAETLRQKAGTCQDKQNKMNLVANDLFDALGQLPDELNGLREKLVQIGKDYNDDEDALQKTRERQKALSTSRWLRFRHQAELKTLTQDIAQFEHALKKLDQQFLKTQQEIEVAYKDPVLKIKEHQKAEMDEEINGLSKQLFTLEERLRANSDEQAQIQASLARRPPPAVKSNVIPIFRGQKDEPAPQQANPGMRRRAA